MAVISLVAEVAQEVQKSTLLSTAWVLFMFFIAVFVVRYQQSPWRKLPPGPSGLPLVGNLQYMTQGQQWVTFAKLKRMYGSIFHLNAAGKPIIVLGSLKVAADLLDRRSPIYSDRPRHTVASDLMTGGMFLATAGFNDGWKRMRKACSEELSKSAASKYQTIQWREAINLTEALLTNGKEWSGHFQRMGSSVLMSLVYGRPVHPSGDPAVLKFSDFMSRLASATSTGTYLVEFFTWMQRVPARLATWKRRILKSFREDSVMFQDLFDGAVRRKAGGDDRPTMAATLIKGTAKTQLSEAECSWIAASTYGAGAERMAGIMSWWLLAMVVYPKTQRQAQEEVDRIVGRDRLPMFDDLKNMPYVRAMVKEILRWAPLDPLGAPHRLTEDDWYNGHFLPKNSIVIANTWGINRDPAIFGEDSCHFNPERHLDEKGQISPGPMDTKEEGHVSYGFGARICAGRHIANNSLFINIATILWAVDIERARDGRGNLSALDLDGVVRHGLAICPVPFDCRITPRSPDVLSILEEAKDG